MPLYIITKKKVFAEQISIDRLPDDRNLDYEMQECLAKLRVWMTENLMAPHGMDKFADS